MVTRTVMNVEDGVKCVLNTDINLLNSEDRLISIHAGTQCYLLASAFNHREWGTIVVVYFPHNGEACTIHNEMIDEREW